MMYSQRFIASLKVGGKILRENSGAVSLPFGSEYEILLKNLNSRRAMCKVTIDGVDATEDTKLILPANGSLTLERFIKNGNLQAGNRFKFIERTGQIEEHRGIKGDDGLVRVEFWAEKEVVDVPVVRHHYYDEWHPRRRYYWDDYPWYPYNKPSITWTAGSPLYGATYGVNSQTTASGGLGGGLLRSAQCSVGEAQNSQIAAMNCSVQPQANDAGITVAGSQSNQQFQSSLGFHTESNSQVIVLQLRGVVGDASVKKAVTVDFKPTCPTCGKVNKISHQFCSNCGTNLHTI